MLGKTEPRIWTKPLKKLTPKNSLGFLFCKFCEEIGVELLPWQKWLAEHSLETVTEGKQWRFRYRYVVILISRQNGKTFFEVLLNLFFLYGLKSHLVLGTAQNLETATETFEDTVAQIEDTPELNALLDRVRRGAGHRELVLDSGERYKVIAATRKARGLSSDLIMMDELREQQNWDAWGAISKTMMARPTAILFGLSNAGDMSSVVLRQLRLQAHAMLGDPDGVASNRHGLGGDALDDDSLGLFEWSAEPNCDLNDKEQWAQANPSLGYGFMTERALKSAMVTDPESVFRTECLCQWVETILPQPFPDGSWEGCFDAESNIAPESDLYFGIDLSNDRRWTSIGVCGLREDGNWHIEVVARAVGTEWAIDWFRERAMKGRMRLAFQGRGAPVTGLAEQICTIQNVERYAVEGSELAAGWGRFWDGVAASDPALPRGGTKIFHLKQPILDTPAQTMQVRQMGGGVALPDRRKSPDDIAPLFACIMAFTAAIRTEKEGNKIYESAYAREGYELVFC
jgi:hypothetical protein